MIKLLSLVNHGYRIAATGCCFICFGIGGILFSVIVFPLQRLLISDLPHRQKIARHTVHLSFKFFIGMMHQLRIFNFDFSASAQLQQARGNIIIANHPCLIDVVALIAMTPNADCVVKAGLFRNPFIRGVITSTGYISNSDPDALINDCAASLASGNNLIIFPEGTRTTPGSLLSFQRGAANIALRSQASFLALSIRCQPTTLTKQEAWYQVPATKPTLAIHFLKEIRVTDYSNADSPSLAARQLTRDLQHYYRQVVNRYECTETGSEAFNH
ncbi:lysophospholipid acyltransferase family protein [Chromatiaceae bacterium AAb-1]|nr:lysophospholipid acyltransferase family protein [Chromatiaceae bacterium AAb-1]